MIGRFAIMCQLQTGPMAWRHSVLVCKSWALEAGMPGKVLTSLTCLEQAPAQGNQSGLVLRDTLMHVHSKQCISCMCITDTIMFMCVLGIDDCKALSVILYKWKQSWGVFLMDNLTSSPHPLQPKLIFKLRPSFLHYLKTRVILALLHNLSKVKGSGTATVLFISLSMHGFTPPGPHCLLLLLTHLKKPLLLFLTLLCTFRCKSALAFLVLSQHTLTVFL